MIRMIALVIVLWLPANVASAERYGNCIVFTSADDFTDEIYHVTIGCHRTWFSDSVLDDYVLLSCAGPAHDPIAGWAGRGAAIPYDRIVILLTGLQSHLGETIPVKYRFDRGVAQSEEWRPHVESGTKINSPRLGFINGAFNLTDSTFNGPRRRAAHRRDVDFHGR